jgi:hypothetical protein
MMIARLDLEVQGPTGARGRPIWRRTLELLALDNRLTLCFVDDDRALLGLLLQDTGAPISSREICRELAWTAFRVDDALASLVRSGLAHRHGEFAWASHTAGRAAELV